MFDTFLLITLIILALGLIVIFSFLLFAIGYVSYMFIFRTKKEYIKYGDRFVPRYRDKKTGKFL